MGENTSENILAIREMKLWGKKRQREDRDQTVVHSPSVEHYALISSMVVGAARTVQGSRCLLVVACWEW